MSNLVQPDRLAIVYCPEHKGGEFLILNKGEEVLKYHVTRVVWKINGEVYTYRYPPVMFVLAALESYQTLNPNQPLGLGEEKCAVCRGFDFPHFKGKI